MTCATDNALTRRGQGLRSNWTSETYWSSLRGGDGTWHWSPLNSRRLTNCSPDRWRRSRRRKRSCLMPKTTFCLKPAGFSSRSSEGAGLVLGAKQSFCQSCQKAAFYFARTLFPQSPMPPFCAHLFRPDGGRHSFNWCDIIAKLSEQKTKTVLASLGNTVSIYE